MHEGMIEITQPVKVEASVSFWIDKDEWEAASDDHKRDIVAAKCSEAGDEFDRTGGMGGLYLVIDSWLPHERIEYDPAQEPARSE